MIIDHYCHVRYVTLRYTTLRSCVDDGEPTASPSDATFGHDGEPSSHVKRFVRVVHVTPLYVVNNGGIVLRENPVCSNL